MNMLKGLADSLLGGAGENTPPQPQPAAQNSAPSPPPQASQPSAASPLGGLNLGSNELAMIMKVKAAYDKMNQNDAGNNSTQLILALKPHLSEKRQQKADQAMQLMRMMDMLPLLKELF